jgi:hypothetical protein
MISLRVFHVSQGKRSFVMNEIIFSYRVWFDRCLVSTSATGPKKGRFDLTGDRKTWTRVNAGTLLPFFDVKSVATWFVSKCHLLLVLGSVERLLCALLVRVNCDVYAEMHRIWFVVNARRSFPFRIVPVKPLYCTSAYTSPFTTDHSGWQSGSWSSWLLLLNRTRILERVRVRATKSAVWSRLHRENVNNSLDNRLNFTFHRTAWVIDYDKQ